MVEVDAMRVFWLVVAFVVVTVIYEWLLLAALDAGLIRFLP